MALIAPQVKCDRLRRLVINRLILEQFRCHRSLNLSDLGARMALCGPNGRGKTSVLEAIHLLSRCRSFRTPRIAECAAWGGGKFGIAAWLASDVDTVRHLKFEWSRAGRQLAHDQASNLKLRDFWGLIQSIAVTGGDRVLISGSGSIRRAWLDGLIAATNPAYLQTCQSASLLLRQKNALLKHASVDRRVWTALTTPMRSFCATIVEARTQWIATLAPQIAEHYAALTGHRESLSLIPIPETSRRLQRHDDEVWAAELRTRQCELGCHRDDWDVQLNGKSLRHFGSEGQQKSAALAMRLTEIVTTFEKCPRRTVVLIDDALSELDEGRRARFWQRLPAAAQVWFATTDPSRDRSVAGFDQEIELPQV